MSFLILGCGYTGSRVAARLMARGERVIAASREPEKLRGLGVEVIRFGEALPALNGMRVLHSLPVPYARQIHGAARLVYLSTTGVYGEQHEVNERTPVSPAGHARLDEERGVAAACANHLILRPAAIYGPGRGVHVSMQEGRHKYWGDGSNYISRIHVDDLAVITEAALRSDLTGAYPVADDEPARAIGITRFCAELLGIPVPPPEPGIPGQDTRRANRRVDGRAIRQALGVTLAFPSFRIGIPAAIRESKLMAAPSLK
jgi:nucleoside-diphosphate-sugar epimerase